ncbi:hypothetical protein NE237_007943 [Protea cynaroides]|uniref:Uncharacterized protein n=1 Tax=Protea cynaroides TaxID=273540 RepID=A0A9Q0KR45_9MAGN|nr:hypothetical protein NE237_007943 [Protea cynaroides]
MIISPAPTFRKIWKKGAVEGFEPDPYLASVVNCMLWVFYGLPLVHPDSLLVVTINSVGLSVATIYVIIYFIYAPAKKRGKVIKTKSVEYMPFLQSLTSFLNGSVWVIYMRALLRFDPYILVGNGLGALAGLVQLIIYAIYYKSTPKNKDNRRNESGLELPTTQEQTRG